MTSNDDRYGKNRNRWKRTYGYGPKLKPRIITFRDQNTQGSFSINLQETSRHTDYHEIRQVGVIPLDVEYDEGIITFDGDTVVTQSFNILFSQAPYTVFTIESISPGGVRVNVYGEKLSTTNVCYAVTNVPFYGTIRYRAAGAGQNFPVLVSNEYTSSFYVVAGEYNLDNDSAYNNEYTIPAGDLEALATAYDVSGTFDANVATETTSVTLSEMSGSTTAPIRNPVHFIISSQ